MNQWQVWAEGAALAVGAAVAGAFVDSVQSGQPFSAASFKATALAAGLTALVAYLRKSPTDPRRPSTSPTKGQVIDMASRVKGPDGPPMVVPAAEVQANKG